MPLPPYPEKRSVNRRAGLGPAPTEIRKHLGIRRPSEPNLSPAATKARFQPVGIPPKGYRKLSGSGHRPEANPLSTRAFAMTAKAA